MKIIVKARPRAKVEKVERVGQDGFDFGPGFENVEKRGESAHGHGQITEAEHVATYKVWVKEPPIDGKANDAIVRVLAEYFVVAKSHIRLVSGQTSKQKTFEIGQ